MTSKYYEDDRGEPDSKSPWERDYACERVAHRTAGTPLELLLVTGTLADAAIEARPGSVEFWARERPDAIAAIEGERSLSWRQWNDLADKVAEGLTARGLGEGDIVVVRTQIRLEWLVISAALAKLGCSLLGLNWRLTPSETEYVLANSGASAVICDDTDPAILQPVIETLGIGLAVSIDVAADGFADYADLVASPGQPRLSAAEAPLIIYTSGTTGLPKGVEMGSRGAPSARLDEYMRSIDFALPKAADDVVMVTMPFSHGAGPAQVRRAVALGSRIVLLRRYDPEATLETIARHRVTTWVAVPTMIKRMASLPAASFARHDLSSVRCIQVGAAPVTQELKHWIVAQFGVDVLHEGYGATETGMIAHMSPDMQLAKPGSSGRPYAHVEIEVRDEQGVLLDAGTPGEIWVRTPAVITSYLNAPPLGEDVRDARGFFRTGDIGQVDGDGYLYITDRAKDMIVSGGVNIYPAEIEAALLRHPDIQDAAVIGIPDDEFGEQVMAFVEPRPGRSIDVAAIADHARSELASYKRPRSIEIIDELPRNLTGKILKRDLRAPYWDGKERKI